MKRELSTVKKFISVLSCTAIVLSLSSCYSSTVNVGDLKPTDPAVHVATAHEAHFINGLIGSTKRDAKNYVGDNKDYRVKQYQSFVDGLLGTITAGIYTPTTTKFYLPYGVTATKVKKEKGLPIKLGVRAGLNLSTVSFEKYIGTLSMRTGFNAGFILDIPISKSFYIQPGVYYTQKGSKLKIEEATATFTQSYVELPVLVSYRYALTDNVQLQINAGPYFAERVKTKMDSGDYSFSSDAGSLDAGVQAGAGILYAKHYYAGAGYEWGFVNQDVDGTKSKNKNFFINIGYNF